MAAVKSEPRRWWLVYSGEAFLGEIGADNYERACRKAEREYDLPAKAIRVVSKATGKEPKATGQVDRKAEAERHDRIVRDGMAKFREVGMSLLAIKEGKLYRELGHGTFEAYLESSHRISRSSGYRILDAVKVANRIAEAGAENVPALGQNYAAVEPESEMQVRSLKTVEPERQAEAWAVAVEESGGDQPTAAKVSEVAERFGGRSLVEGQTGPRMGRTRINGREATEEEESRLRANGRIPVGVDIEVTDPGDEATDLAAVKEEHAERKAIAESDLSDEDWLATLPLASTLSGVSLDTFRRDAIAFRDANDLFEKYGIKSGLRRIIKAANPLGRPSGAYASFLSRLLRRQHPKDWKICPPKDKGGCDGSGSLIGGQCNACSGRGYVCQ